MLKTLMTVPLSLAVAMRVPVGLNWMAASCPVWAGIMDIDARLSASKICNGRARQDIDMAAQVLHIFYLDASKAATDCFDWSLLLMKNWSLSCVVWSYFTWSSPTLECPGYAKKQLSESIDNAHSPDLLGGVSRIVWSTFMSRMLWM